MTGAPLYSASPARSTGLPVAAETARPMTPSASTAGTDHHHRPTPRHRTARRPRSRSPSVPCQPRVTTIAAKAGPIRPGRWVGQPTPVRVTCPRTAMGTHHSQENAKASTTKVARAAPGSGRRTATTGPPGPPPLARWRGGGRWRPGRVCAASSGSGVTSHHLDPSDTSPAGSPRGGWGKPGCAGGGPPTGSSSPGGVSNSPGGSAALPTGQRHSRRVSGARRGGA